MNNLKNRSLFSGRDTALILMIIFLSSLIYFLLSLHPKSGFVVIERDGAVLYEINYLTLCAPTTREVDGYKGTSVVISIDSDGAVFTDSQCPDKLCVRAGKISRPGQSAICLPARISCRITGNKKNYDAMVY